MAFQRRRGRTGWAGQSVRKVLGPWVTYAFIKPVERSGIDYQFSGHLITDGRRSLAVRAGRRDLYYMFTVTFRDKDKGQERGS